MKTELESLSDLKELQAQMRAYFDTQASFPLKARLAHLRQFKAYLQAHEEEILDALYQDLGKSSFESLSCELMLVYDEMDYCMRHLKRWMRTRSCTSPKSLLPSWGKIYPRPKGLALIIAPWNYPLNLSLVPLVDALAAGNCVVLKCAQASAATSKLVKHIIEEVFAPEHVCVVTGSNINDFLLKCPWDQVLFTGSPSSGKRIAKSCGKTLSPVILELGGKSPCIVDKDADLKVAAERIVWGKSLNAGQTCVAPDYLLVHESVHDRFIELVKQAYITMFGEDITHNPEWPKLINQAQYDKIQGLYEAQSALTPPVFSGEPNPSALKFAPALFSNVELEHPIMQDEIFGPLVPVMRFESFEDALTIIRSFESPLALYYFGRKESQMKHLVNSLAFGGACMNDVVCHVANNHLPFGGIGNSGMGQYHGKAGFDAFTHYVPVLRNPTRIHLRIRQAPYQGKLKLLRRLIR